MARVLEKALGVLQGRIGMVHLRFEQPDPRYTLSSQPREPQASLRQMATLGVEPQPDGPGPWNWVIEHNSILVVPDVFEPASAAPNAEAAAPGEKETRQMSPVLFKHLRESAACTYVGVPVHAKGRALGVMSVFGRSMATFSPEDIALLAAIADHLGGAVENSQLRQKAEQAAVVEERQRLARDLHDSVTQSLYSLVLFASAGREALDPAYMRENGEDDVVSESPSVEAARRMLNRLTEVSQQALKELRLLIFELRPLALQKEGLTSALRSRLETVEQRAGMRAVLLADHAASLPAEIESGLYGIAQEALNNTLKHAQASQVTARFEVWPDRVELEISDNGRGFSFDPDAAGVGFGLASMRERALALGGELSVRSEAGRGTSILVHLKRAAG
jgi:signal transduction histidine kinase